MDAAITKALAKAPTDRFATAAQFGEALEAPAQRARDTGRRTSRLAAGAGLAATLVVAAAGLFVLSRPHGTPALAGPPRPSIAVLAVVNVSGAPPGGYLGGGIREERLNAASKAPQPQVGAPPSPVAIKGEKQELGPVR